MKHTYLVLFSGGKDSFLSACRLLNDGHKVALLSFNGGAVCGEENIKSGAERIVKRYGSDNATYEGVYSTAATIRRLESRWAYFSQKELGERYPNLTNCQFQCLHCQTAMWTAAIAYCLAKDIKFIASGCKENDIFCTGNVLYLNRIKDIASKHGISIVFPLWELKNDWEREIEMVRYGFLPSVLEPKCLIGRPPKNGELCEAERVDMESYFADELAEAVEEGIERLRNIFKYMHLGDKSLVPFTWPEDSDMGGLF